MQSEFLQIKALSDNPTNKELAVHKYELIVSKMLIDFMQKNKKTDLSKEEVRRIRDEAIRKYNQLYHQRIPLPVD